MANTSGVGSADCLTEIVVIQKSRRVGHLLCSAKLVLVYLQLWQLSLIVCNLSLVFTSAFRKRPYLLMHGRHFYWFYFLVTLPLIAWFVVSITVVLRRKDNLNGFSTLALFALVLILNDLIILCCVMVSLVANNGINDYLHAILGNSEVLHHCLLTTSRIVCFGLWLVFVNAQLSHTKWSHLLKSRQVNLETILNDVFSNLG